MVQVLLSLLAIACLAGCAARQDQYPLAWGEIPAPASVDCLHYAGRYADRGEAIEQRAQPSLTRELLGGDSDWQSASHMELSLPAPGSVEVTVWQGEAKLLERALSAERGEVHCDQGRLVLRSQRWTVSGLMSGRERVRLELDLASEYLVARVDESAMGLALVFVPLAGESTRWYRFRRISR